MASGVEIDSDILAELEGFYIPLHRFNWYLDFEVQLQFDSRASPP